MSLFIFFQALSNSADAQSVSLSKSIYAPRESIVVTYSGFPGNSRDWISIATQGSGDDKYVAWKYTGGNTSGTLSFDGINYGDFEIRGYYNDELIVRTRTSFRVGNPDVNLIAKTQQATYKPNEKIVVQYSGLPGNVYDWISLASVGSGDDKYVAWQYTNTKQSGTMEFDGLAEGKYEVRIYFNQEWVVRSRYPFVVSNRTSTNPSQLCRGPLSVFYAGMTGLGSAWARTTCEPTIMTAVGVADMQGVLGNARDGLNMMKDCIPFDIGELTALINKLPTLTNIQAEAEIQALIIKLQEIIARSNATCDNGITLSSLFVTGVHVGAAQAHASCRICQPAPMPMAFQTVIRNHLNTARDAFAGFLSCVPNFSLNQFDAVPLNSINSIEAHTHIVGLQTNILWNISLSDCCCDCR
ncbi:MAG: hypothetical protein A2W11_02450 [Ignavibacteria bacterium RBG_16_35_7]|nr:MAG: hypothetical protein A2W11_02450 [Ignavibacteria bacterium RBG_16_35_7]